MNWDLIVWFTQTSDSFVVFYVTNITNIKVPLRNILSRNSYRNFGSVDIWFSKTWCYAVRGCKMYVCVVFWYCGETVKAVIKVLLQMMLDIRSYSGRLIWNCMCFIEACQDFHDLEWPWRSFWLPVLKAFNNTISCKIYHLFSWVWLSVSVWL